MSDKLLVELGKLTTETLQALRNLMEFKAFTERSYQLTKDAMSKNDSYTATIRYSQFGAVAGMEDLTLTASDIVAQLEGYHHRLQILALQQLVTIVERHIMDFLQMLLVNDPRHLSGKKQLEFSAVLAAGSIEVIIRTQADKELAELSYKSLEDWFGRLNEICRFKKPTADQIATLAEVKATRDLWVHGMGIINAVYLKKAAAKARGQEGAPAIVDAEYFLTAWQLSATVVKDMLDQATQRLSRTS